MARDALSGMDGVREFVQYRRSITQVGRADVDVFAFEGAKGLHPTIVEGRAPATASEVAIGLATARRLDVAVGDWVEVAGTAGSQRLTVVGTAIYPYIGNASYGETLSMTAEAFDEIGLETLEGGFLVDANGRPNLERLQAAVGESLSVLPPTSAPAVTRLRDADRDRRRARSLLRRHHPRARGSGPLRHEQAAHRRPRRVARHRLRARRRAHCPFGPCARDQRVRCPRRIAPRCRDRQRRLEDQHRRAHRPRTVRRLDRAPRGRRNSADRGLARSCSLGCASPGDDEPRSSASFRVTAAGSTRAPRLLTSAQTRALRSSIGQSCSKRYRRAELPCAWGPQPPPPGVSIRRTSPALSRTVHLSGRRLARRS